MVDKVSESMSLHSMFSSMVTGPLPPKEEISPFSQFIPNKKDQPMCTKGPIYRVGQWLAQILLGSFPKGLAMMWWAQIYDMPLIGLGRDAVQHDISRGPSAGVGRDI